MEKALTATLLFLFVTAVSGQAQDRESLWIARGVQAMKTLELLKTTYNKNPNEESRYKMIIEQAFAGLAKNPRQLTIKEAVSTQYILSHDFGKDGTLEIVYMEWGEQMPHPGTAFVKIRSVPKGYSAIIASNGDIDIYFDNGKKYYRVLVFPFHDGLEARAHL